jgi:DNA-binding NarL/FixJ family response regulator
MISVALADDQGLVRMGLRVLIESERRPAAFR